MVNKYKNFLLEKIIYDLINESSIEFSKDFIKILGKISHPIAKDILSLQSKDKKVNYNYIDVDLKSNDEITFIQDSKARRLVKDIESTYIIQDQNGHLKISNFSTNVGEEQNRHIYELLGFNIEDAKKAPNGNRIRILNKILSPYNRDKIYVLYESVSDSSLKAVINIQSIVEERSEYEKLWTTSRNPLKIGRFITAMLPLTGKTYSDSEKEKFVSEWKSVISEINDDFFKFEVVSGRDIYELYQEESYERREGTIGKSCMRDASSDMLSIYTDNPDVCKLVVKRSDIYPDKITARALLWDVEDVKNGGYDKFMDRIYTIDSSDEELFKKFAEKNGWWYKEYQNSSNDFNVKRDSNIKKPIYVVSLSRKRYYEYPYLDSLCYYNSYDNTLSNNKRSIGADCLLNDVSGGYERLI